MLVLVRREPNKQGKLAAARESSGGPPTGRLSWPRPLLQRVFSDSPASCRSVRRAKPDIDHRGNKRVCTGEAIVFDAQSSIALATPTPPDEGIRSSCRHSRYA